MYGSAWWDWWQRHWGFHISNPNALLGTGSVSSSNSSNNISLNNASFAPSRSLCSAFMATLIRVIKRLLSALNVMSMNQWYWIVALFYAWVAMLPRLISELLVDMRHCHTVYTSLVLFLILPSYLPPMSHKVPDKLTSHLWSSPTYIVHNEKDSKVECAHNPIFERTIYSLQWRAGHVECGLLRVYWGSQQRWRWL